jgi:hypothetical protein
MEVLDNTNKSIIRNTEISGEQLLKLLENEEITVYEDIQGSKIFVNWNFSTKHWEIRPKSINGHLLNMVDLATQNYYKWAYAFLISLPVSVTDLLRKGFQFGFEYFPDNQPANVEYDKKPKNGLILTTICKYGKYYSTDRNELKVYSELFDVDLLPVIYIGKLNERQLRAINYYLHTGPADLEFLYEEISFAKFFYNLLTPNTKNSFLKNDDFNKNCEKMIVRFLKSNTEITLEILNPIYKKMIHQTESEFSDVYSILLFSFVQYLLTYKIEEDKIAGNSRDLLYINFISKLFNLWIEKNEQGIIDFKFSVPTFFNSNKFKINQDLIHNQTTLDWINKNPKFEYCFKIILSSFQKERKKTIGVINNQALLHLNTQIRKVQLRIEELLNWNHKLNQFAYKQKDLTKFPNIKWEEDNDGKVYPDMTGILDVSKEDKKKTIKKGFTK